MNKEIKLRARRSDISMGADRIRLFAFVYGDKSTSVAKDLEFVQNEKYEFIEPFVTIEMPEAQVLMDDLWEAGVRPTEAKGSAGAMAAVQKHLTDMRKIAFHKLGIRGEQK